MSRPVAPFLRSIGRLALDAMSCARSSVSIVAAARFVAALLLAVQFAAFPLSSAAAQQKRSVGVVRDAEIEALVRDYALPILKAAGLERSGVEIVLVNDASFNAFVAGRRIFMHTGALMAAETPGEIIGVLAHEAGHIAGGHQERLRQQLARAQTMAVIATVLGVGVTAAGAATTNSGLAQSGAAIFMGGGEMARRSVLTYQRTEETTADRSALTYLERTGQSAAGMLATFRRFQSDLALSGSRVDPYQISHPMPRERIANIETLARQSPYFDRKDPAALQLRHDLARAKIAAYTQGRTSVARMFRDDPRGLPALYGDAITTFLSGNARAAVGKIDGLVQAQPGNPYFHEMRGEILMKAGRPADAASAFAKAFRLDPNKSGIIQVGYGQALLANGKPREAISELKTGLNRAKEFAAGYRYLAQAQAQLGDIGEAELATAEGHFYSGSYRDAKIFAARAQQKMANGSPGWLRAQDIINYRQPGKD